jgi:hypothetical protein
MENIYQHAMWCRGLNVLCKTVQLKLTWIYEREWKTNSVSSQMSFILSTLQVGPEYRHPFGTAAAVYELHEHEIWDTAHIHVTPKVPGQHSM